MKILKVDSQGRIAFAGQPSKTTVSPLLIGEPIGFDPIEGHWMLNYGPVAIAEATLRNKVLASTGCADPVRGDQAPGSCHRATRTVAPILPERGSKEPG